jgi:hypothetical protein
MHRLARNAGLWLSNLYRVRFANRAAGPLPAIADAASPLCWSEQENDIFAELIAASSLLDFGGTLPEPRLKDTDLDRGLRPW